MAELQRKTIYVGNSWQDPSVPRNVPIILDAIQVRQEIENNRSLVRATLRKEQVLDSNYAWSDQSNATLQGQYQDTGKIYYTTSIIKTLEFWVNHNEDGTASVNVSGAFNTNNGGVTLGGNLPLTTIPRNSMFVKVDDFKLSDGVNVEIEQYTDLYHTTLKIFENGYDTPLKTLENYETTLVTFTDEEKDLIYSRNKETDYVTLNYELITYNSNNEQVGSTQYKSSKATFDYTKPTFTNYEFEDVNTNIVNLTNNNQNFIKNYSNIVVKINDENKALPKNYAYIKNYKAIIGEQQIIFDNIEGTITSPILHNVANNQMLVQAIDSRNFESDFVIKYPNEWIAYDEITIKEFNVIREDGGISESVRLQVSGTFFNNTFGTSGEQNTLQMFYAFGNNTQREIEYEELDLTINGNNYSFNGLIKGDLGASGFNIDNEYVITILLKDLLNTSGISDDEILGTGTPNLALADTGQVAIKKIVDLDKNYALDVNGAINSTGLLVDGEEFNPDSVPTGSILDYTGNDIPDGYEEVIDDGRILELLGRVETISGTINAPYTDFKYIYIEGTFENKEYSTLIIPTFLIQLNRIYYANLSLNGYSRRIGLKFTSSTNFVVHRDHTSCGISSICGIGVNR